MKKETIQIVNARNVKMTDEETYQMIKKDKSGLFMDADEWKKSRLKFLKKEGRKWSK